MKFILSIIAILFLPATAHAQRSVVAANFSVYVAPATGCTSGYWPDTMAAVTTCGSDATGSGTQAAPWATLQYARSILYSEYDWVGQFAPTIVLAVAHSPGNFLYDGLSLSGRMVGQPGVFPTLPGGSLPDVSTGNYNPFVLMGDKNYQLGAIINPGTGDRPNVNGISLTDGASLKVIGVTIDTTHSNTSLTLVYNGLLDISYVTLGNAGAPGTGGIDQLGGAFGGTILITGPLVNAGNGSSFAEVGPGGVIMWDNNGQLPMTVTCTNTSTRFYPGGMFRAIFGRIEMAGVTFPGCGSISGPGAVAQMGGVIQTNSGTSAPQSCAGSYFPPNISGAQLDIEDYSVCR